MRLNTSRLTQGNLITGAGAVVLFIALFLNWDDAAGSSGWSTFSGMNIVMFLVILATVAYVGLTALEADVPSGSEWVIFLLGVLVTGWALGYDLENPSAGVGAWFGLFAAGAIAFGASEATIRRVPARAAPTASARSRSQAPPPSR
jgi:hypothetical protein